MDATSSLPDNLGVAYNDFSSIFFAEQWRLRYSVTSGTIPDNMPKKTLVRSLSESHVKPRTFCKVHSQRQFNGPQKHRNQREDIDSIRSNPSQNIRNYGSYWSPAISENGQPTVTGGQKYLRRFATVQTLIFTFIALCYFYSQAMFVTLIKGDRLDIYPCLITFHCLAFLSAIIAPVVINRFSANKILFVSGLSGICYACCPLLTTGFILLPVSAVCGMIFGLTSVLQGTEALNLGLQFAYVREHVDGKSTAGDWYLWTQVVVQCGIILGSMMCSSAIRFMADSPAWEIHGKPVSAKVQLGTI